MIEKLKKIYELSIRGEAGERELAAQRLRELLAKYKLTLHDVLETERKTYTFRLKNKIEITLFGQIVSKVLNTFDFKMYQLRHTRGVRLVDLTPAEAVEVKLMLETYKKAFDRELTRCLQGFIQVNELFPPAEESDNLKPLTEAERDELRKIWHLSQGMNKTPIPRRQITS